MYYRWSWVFHFFSNNYMHPVLFFFPQREESRQNPHVNQGSIGHRKILEQQLITECMMFSLIFLNNEVVPQRTLALQVIISMPAVQWLSICSERTRLWKFSTGEASGWSKSIIDVKNVIILKKGILYIAKDGDGGLLYTSTYF